MFVGFDGSYERLSGTISDSCVLVAVDSTQAADSRHARQLRDSGGGQTGV
jgi:hypothetical protein